MNLPARFLPFALLLAALPLCAADAVFSGPQPGEKTTPFNVLELTGPAAGTECNPIQQHDGAPTALVFIHGIERSLVPLLRVVDEYGALRRDSLRTEIIFLAADRLQGEQRVKAAAGSLKLQSHIGLSLEGAEGPGNYGLNKECLMTIVAAKENTVTANFALVQPGIADAPKVLAALAKVSGDTNPPTADELSQRHMARTGGGRDGGAIRRGGAGMTAAPAADLTKFDLNTEEGLRGAVRALIGEVRSLRSELEAVRVGGGKAPAREKVEKPKEAFPGAVPTDDKLQGLLRRFIRPTNDDATVDAVLTEVRGHIKDDAGLKQQAIDGWVRILHFGDHYGTEYSRKVGRAFLEELQGAKK